MAAATCARLWRMFSRRLLIQGRNKTTAVGKMWRAAGGQVQAHCTAVRHLRALQKERIHGPQIQFLAVMTLLLLLLLLPLIAVLLKQAAAHSVRHLLQNGLQRALHNT